MRPHFLLPAAIAACASLLSACDDAAQPTSPAAMSQAVAGRVERLVTMFDGCDPESFTAQGALCTRQGGITFDNFVSLLEKHQSVGAWRFSPGSLDASVGQTLRVVNHGGEVHTFTEVEAFGGGFVEALNTLSGNPDPAPECLGLVPAAFIPPGATLLEAVNKLGTEHYQCCIHPWMRFELQVRR